MSDAIIRWYQCLNAPHHDVPATSLSIPVSVPYDGPWAESHPCPECGEAAKPMTRDARHVYGAVHGRRVDWSEAPVKHPEDR